MVVANTFWENFFLLLIFLPLAMIWVFALMDIFRRDDIGGGWKAVWVACVILVPFFGTLAYLIVRPAGVTEDERMLRAEARREFAAQSPADETSQLQVARRPARPRQADRRRVRRPEGPPARHQPFRAGVTAPCT